MVANERARVMPPPRKHKTKHRSKSEERRSVHSQSQSQYNTDHEGSDIYVTSGAYRAPSEIR